MLPNFFNNPPGTGGISSGGAASGAWLPIVSGNIASGQIGTNHFASGQILGSYIRSGEIGQTQIGNGAVGDIQIRVLSVGTANIANQAISSGKLDYSTPGNQPVIAGTIGSGAVVSGNIASGQIGVNHLAVVSGVGTSGQVLALDGAGALSWKADATGGGVASGAWLPITSGDIGSGQVGALHLATSGQGTSGQILSLNGAGMPLLWVAPPAGSTPSKAMKRIGIRLGTGAGSPSYMYRSLVRSDNNGITAVKLAANKVHFCEFTAPSNGSGWIEEIVLNTNVIGGFKLGIYDYQDNGLPCNRIWSTNEIWGLSTNTFTPALFSGYLTPGEVYYMAINNSAISGATFWCSHVNSWLQEYNYFPGASSGGQGTPGSCLVLDSYSYANSGLPLMAVGSGMWSGQLMNTAGADFPQTLYRI